MQKKCEEYLERKRSKIYEEADKKVEYVTIRL